MPLICRTSYRSFAPEGTSQSLITLSSPQVASVVPSVESAIERTPLSVPLIVASRQPFLASHNWIVSSKVTDTIRSPPGRNVAALIPLAPLGPLNFNRSCAVFTSHRRTVLSEPAEANVAPSGENATHVADPSSPCFHEDTSRGPSSS